MEEKISHLTYQAIVQHNVRMSVMLDRMQAKLAAKRREIWNAADVMEMQYIQSGRKLIQASNELANQLRAELDNV